MNYENVTILLPAMDETYSLKETVETILHTCRRADLCEIIYLLCDKTTEESRKTAESLISLYGRYIPMYIHEQELPGVGGAIREGIMLAKGSHVVMMSSDLETDPNVIKRFIAEAKKAPDHIITATRWKRGGGFEHYNKVKLVCNLIFEKSIAALFYGVGLSDLTYAYRIFPSELMQSIKWEELKHPFFLETALKPLRLRVKFIEVTREMGCADRGSESKRLFCQFQVF